MAAHHLEVLTSTKNKLDGLTISWTSPFQRLVENNSNLSIKHTSTWLNRHEK